MDAPFNTQDKQLKIMPLLTACCLAMIIFNIIFLLRIQNPPVPTVTDDYLEKEKTILLKRNAELEMKSDSLLLVLFRRDLKIKELQTQKKEKEYVYSNKVKQIDGLNVNGLLMEYHRFFSNDTTVR